MEILIAFIFIFVFLIISKIMKDKPCCFLDTDGKCGIYENRQSVCRNFPHTNKPYRLYNMYWLLSFAEECPVVFEIIERLKKYIITEAMIIKGINEKRVGGAIINENER